ncbi:hypothetical protein ScFU6_05810 [Streptococcus canis]|nr:hypothetical protein ScFU6_05810 [Streptococcus canis]
MFQPIEGRFSHLISQNRCHFIVKTTDIFELLNSSLIRYKLDSWLTSSQFILKILNNGEKSLKLPIAITDTAIYSG